MQENEAETLHLWATPTASTRTLLVWPNEEPERAFFAKLSLNSRLLGDRRLRRERVAASVGLSQFVLSLSTDLPDGVRWLPEPFGMIPRRMSAGGVILRAVPDEIRGGKVFMAPLFALMGGSTDHPPLLLKLMQEHGGGALEIVKEVLLEKFAILWLTLVFDLGLILEAHGQDLLLTLSPDLVPLGGFYYRDFEGLTVDWALRRALGMREPQSLPHAVEWFSAYETWGYPRYQLVSTKMMISLFDYFQFVLRDLESALMEWQGTGVVAGIKVSDGELTSLFSRHLRREIDRKFGMRERDEYNVSAHLCRFVRFLMEVRREIVHTARC